MIEPLPPQQGGGRRWRDHRQVINARLRLWTKDGTWDKIPDRVIVKDDAVGDLEWIISVDSSVVGAHQHAAGAWKRGLGSPISVARLGPGQRNVVERCFNRLKQFRDLTTRYAKRAACYQAELTIAAIVLLLR